MMSVAMRRRVAFSQAACYALLFVWLPAAVIGQSFAGAFCGTTDNNVLTLNFTFPNPSNFVGNASFQMTDFESETFPLCPTESYQFTPANEEERSVPRNARSTSEYLLGVLNFAGLDPANAGSDCMAVQLQWMWITGFQLNCYGSTVGANSVNHMKLVAGAFSMDLLPC